MEQNEAEELKRLVSDGFEDIHRALRVIATARGELDRGGRDEIDHLSIRILRSATAIKRMIKEG